MFCRNAMFVVVLVFILISCSERKVEKPKNLDEMFPMWSTFKEKAKSHSLTLASAELNSVYFYYCLPGFIPISLSECRHNLPALKNPSVIQLNFSNVLNMKNFAGLKYEWGYSYIPPFPVNNDLEGKTPYANEYRKLTLRKKNSGVFLESCSDCSGFEFDDLQEFKVKGSSYRRIWVPNDIEKYTTKIGNPYVFHCFDPHCVLTIDWGDGWVIRARFYESSLRNWKQVIENLNNEIIYFLGN